MYRPGQLRGKRGSLFERLGRAPTKALAQRLRPAEPRAAFMIYRSWVRAFWQLWSHAVLSELSRTSTPDFERLFRELLRASGIDGVLRRVGAAVTANVASYMRSIFKPGQAPPGVRTDAATPSVPRLSPFASAEQERLIDEWRIENLRLIQGASEEHVQELAEVFKAAQESGLGFAELIEKIKERLSVGLSRAKLIARDQTTKFNGTIQAVQQRAAGITEFVWSTSHDGAVRPSHQALDGRTFSWAVGAPDGGELVLPGQAINCRCQPIPVIPLFAGLD